MIEKGIMPPQATDLEMAVIGAMLVDSRGVDEVMSVLPTPEAFFGDKNKQIFIAISSLYKEGNPIDLLSVSAELRKLGLYDRSGGDMYLIGLTQRIASSAHAEYHSRIVMQKFMSRSVIAFSSQIIALANDPETDVFELMQRWQKEFDKVVDYTATGRTTMSFPAALIELKASVELLSNNQDEIQLVGIDTGFAVTNKTTGGYRNQDLVIIGARPGMGKTSKVLKMAIENAKKGLGVGFVSLEMSMHQLTARSVSIDTNFHLRQLIKTGFEKKEYFTTLTSHIGRMNDYPIHVDDSGNSDITDVVITAKLWKRKYDIKVLIIDYIQLMVDRQHKGTRADELAGISRRLKKLAKELDIPVVVLAQVGRDCERRPNKRPMISDIKDCGAIEQDADIIEFIYRPEYYKQEMDPEEYGSDMAELIDRGANTEIIYAKYRGGSTGTVLLKWIGDKTKFADVDEYDSFEEVEATAYEFPKVSTAEAFGNSYESHSDDNEVDF